MNIVMVVARDFPVVKAGMDLCELMATFDRATTIIHTRTAKEGGDRFVAEAAVIMGFSVKKWPGEGGAANYIRDVDMVKQADIVYAFFEADHVGEGGTQHVVDKALDQHKRVISFTWDRRLHIVGSDDGTHYPLDDEEVPHGETEVVGEAPEKRTGNSGESSEEGGRRVGFASGAQREDNARSRS